MVIYRRQAYKKPAILARKPAAIIKRYAAGIERSFADNVEEYIFNLPSVPISYIDMVNRYITPYRVTPFELFGRKISLTPYYTANSDGTVNIVGLLVVVHSNRPAKQKINGPRGTWHGRIKYFVKAQMM